MPLVYQQNINEHTKIGVWHIAEEEDFFLSRVPLHRNVTHPKKRLQHFAGRLILSELFNDFPLSLIEIADTNKPYLADELYHFSISHCGDYAAAIVSKTNRVGVDIEIPTEKILRIRHKFLSEKEHFLLSESLFPEFHTLTICWSIKEALYKWYGNAQVDFREHLHIRDIQYNGDSFTADCMVSKKSAVTLTANGIFLNGNCLVWVLS